LHPAVKSNAAAAMENTVNVKRIFFIFRSSFRNCSGFSNYRGKTPETITKFSTDYRFCQEKSYVFVSDKAKFFHKDKNLGSP
jgi:hypothetical protein